MWDILIDVAVEVATEVAKEVVEEVVTEVIESIFDWMLCLESGFWGSLAHKNLCKPTFLCNTFIMTFIYFKQREKWLIQKINLWLR